MRIIPLGVPELDRGIGGGIPHPSLISVEGEHGSGKTVLSQYTVHAFLDKGFKVIVISSEATVREYISMMHSIGLKTKDYFIVGRLRIYPLHVEGGKWSKTLSLLFLRVAGNYLELHKNRFDLAVIDSLSALTLDVEEHDLLTFLTRLKNLVSDGKTILLTFHPDFLPQKLMTKLRAVSDVYFQLKNTSFLGKQVKLLKVIKLWGSGGERKDSIFLEVDPQMGLRVLPLGGVKI